MIDTKLRSRCDDGGDKRRTAAGRPAGRDRGGRNVPRRARRCPARAADPIAARAGGRRPRHRRSAVGTGQRGAVARANRPGGHRHQPDGAGTRPVVDRAGADVPAHGGRVGGRRAIPVGDSAVVRPSRCSCGGGTCGAAVQPRKRCAAAGLGGVDAIIATVLVATLELNLVAAGVVVLAYRLASGGVFVFAGGLVVAGLAVDDEPGDG